MSNGTFVYQVLGIQVKVHDKNIYVPAFVANSSMYTEAKLFMYLLYESEFHWAVKIGN